MQRTLHKASIFCLTLVGLMLAALFSGLPVHAQSGSGTNVGFYVRAVLPDNQQDADLSYFDLRMQPGQSQTLEIEVVNESAGQLVLDIEAISASTGRNGVIDYKTPNVQDETLLYPFSTFTTLGDAVVTVEPNSTTRTSFTIQMPGNAYDGAILGGIRFTQRMEEGGQATGGGTSIQNQYSYVVGVVLTESDTAVPYEFEFFNVEANAENHSATFDHYIRNRAPLIVKGMSIDVDLFHEGNPEPVVHVTREDVDMAPNSVMNLAVTPVSGTQLADGEYTSVVTIQTENDETYSFTRTFVVGRGVIDDMNGMLTPSGTIQSRIPWWVWLLLGLFLLLILFLLFLLFWKRRKDEEEDEEEVVVTHAERPGLDWRGDGGSGDDDL